MKCIVTILMDRDRVMSGEMQEPFRSLSDSLWNAMRGESIFLTGGSGLFGHWFVNSLLAANRRLGSAIQVTILTRDPKAFMLRSPEFFRDETVTLVEGDVVDFDFPDATYSRILHGATTSAHETFHGKDQLKKFETVLSGTDRVLQFAGRCCARKVLFLSSGVVYGSYEAEIHNVPETYSGAPDTTNPSSALGQAKRAAEFLCSYYSEKYEFQYTIARCFSFVGPRLPLDLHYAIGNFIRDALRSKEIILHGDGSPVRSFLYLGDLVVWLQVLLLNGGHGRIYNVGSDKAITILGLAHLVRDLLSPDKNVKALGKREPNIGNFGRQRYVPDITRARNELGLDVWTSLEQSVLKTAEYEMKGWR